MIEILPHYVRQNDTGGNEWKKNGTGENETEQNETNERKRNRKKRTEGYMQKTGARHNKEDITNRGRSLTASPSTQF